MKPRQSATMRRALRAIAKAEAALAKGTPAEGAARLNVFRVMAAQGGAQRADAAQAAARVRADTALPELLHRRGGRLFKDTTDAARALASAAGVSTATARRWLTQADGALLRACIKKPPKAAAGEG